MFVSRLKICFEYFYLTQKQAEEGKDSANQEILDLKASNAGLTEQIVNLNFTVTSLQEKEVCYLFCFARS